MTLFVIKPHAAFAILKSFSTDTLAKLAEPDTRQMQPYTGQHGGSQSFNTDKGEQQNLVRPYTATGANIKNKLLYFS